ncbi:MAG: carboxypeptidase-like regulatory domain-containing protein, partial [Gemmatimonadota bacterium]
MNFPGRSDGPAPTHADSIHPAPGYLPARLWLVGLPPFRLTTLGCLVATALILPVAVAAQNVTTLEGSVSDADSGLPVVAAQVVVMGTSLATTTDLSGRYAITSVPEGNHDVRATAIGYGPETLSVEIGATEIAANFLLTLVSTAVPGQQSPLFRLPSSSDSAAFPNRRSAIPDSVTLRDRLVLFNGFTGANGVDRSIP